MSTIPASEIVRVLPSVLGPGGSSLDVVGLMLTTSTRPPIGTVPSFPDPQSVTDYFGASTPEEAAAEIYFAGFEGADKVPEALLFAQYPSAAVAAYLRGGDVSGLTLTELQAINGSLDITFDGAARNAPAVDLAAATSFSSAATIIQTALNAASPAAASVTGSIGGVVTASAGAAFTGSGSGTNLTASSVTGVIHLGAAIAGTGVPAGTIIVSQTSGSTGGAGVYVTNHATTSSSDSLTASSNVLDVTGITSGTLQATDAISGTGVATGTTILAQLTGSAGSTGTYTISSQQHIASATVTSLSAVLNVTAVGSGTVEVGAVLAGTNVASGTTVTGEGTGTGGTGTYTLSKSSTTISETITASAADVAVTFDSVSGGFIITSGITGALSTAAFATGTISATLDLTSATGAVLSQGAAAATPSAFMNGVLNVTSDWVTYMTLFDPDESGNANKLLFSAWKNTALGGNRFAYVCWDLDAAPTVTLPATSSMGYILANNGDSGTCLLDGDPANGWDAAAGYELAAFICGAAASIDFDARNGRITFAGKAQAGLAATVVSASIADNLAGSPQSSSRGNGYNFYGAYGAANVSFVWFQRGFVTGRFLWLDAYINQIWLNARFQLDLLTLIQNTKSIPYGVNGDALIESALAGTIDDALNFGAFGPGPLSASQVSAVNADAGKSVANTIATLGSYLEIAPSSPTTRAARTSPPCKFWYLDNGSVQAIDLSSIALL